MKKCSILSLAAVLSICMMACSNPQEKAQKVSEDASKAADHAAANAADAHTVAAGNAVAAAIYSNIAAASEAASKVQMPALATNDAKSLAKDLGNLIVKRIAATNADEASRLETDITNERAKIEQKAVDNKISAADKDAILKYGDDMTAAAKAAVGM